MEKEKQSQIIENKASKKEKEMYLMVQIRGT